ncbi:hypothetical protein D9M68_940840 [compost metagenome]
MARTGDDQADAALGTLGLVVDVTVVGQAFGRGEALGVGGLHQAVAYGDVADLQR